MSSLKQTAALRISLGARVIYIIMLCCTSWTFQAFAQATDSSSPAVQLEIEDDEEMLTNTEVESIGLAHAIQIALGDNIDLALARAEEAIGEARAARSRKQFWPSLEVGAEFSRVDGTVQGSFGDFRSIHARGHRLTTALSYSLNIGAQIRDTAASRLELESTVLKTLAAEQQLILHVVELYENLVLAKVGVDIAKHLVEDSGDFERIAAARARGGIGLGADVARAKVSLAASRQHLVRARDLWNEMSVRLAVALRRDPSVLLDPSDNVLEAWAVLPRDAWDASAMVDKRPDVEAARLAVEAADKRAGAARWDLYGPTLSAEARLSGVGGHSRGSSTDFGPALSSASGSAGRSASAWQDVLSASPGALASALSSAAGSGGRAFYAWDNLLDSNSQNVGLQDRENYSVSVFWSFSFAKRERIREAKAVSRRAQLYTDRIKEKANGEVRLAERNMGASRSLIRLAEEELEAAQTHNRIALARFREGTAIALEILDAQEAMAQARLNLATYIVDFNLAKSRLLAASGIIRKETFSG